MKQKTRRKTKEQRRKEVKKMYQYKVKNNRVFKLTKEGKTIAKYNGKKIVFSNTISEEEVKFFILKTSQYLKGCGAFKRFKFIENLQDFEISK